jgi:hypothetical protein
VPWWPGAALTGLYLVTGRGEVTLPAAAELQEINLAARPEPTSASSWELSVIGHLSGWCCRRWRNGLERRSVRAAADDAGGVMRKGSQVRGWFAAVVFGVAVAIAGSGISAAPTVAIAIRQIQHNQVLL